MAFVAVRPLLGGRRGGDLGGFVHGPALSALTSYEKGEAATRETGRDRTRSKRDNGRNGWKAAIPRGV